jgi:hypothetical protein
MEYGKNEKANIKNKSDPKLKGRDIKKQNGAYLSEQSLKHKMSGLPQKSDQKVLIVNSFQKICSEVR